MVEFRQDCDKIIITIRSGLVGRHLTVRDLKTSYRGLSASVQWTKTVCRLNQLGNVMTVKSVQLGAILILDDSAPSLKAVSRDKKIG